jgi:NAD(P)-dependent dehydrogenase (short-subunit alcohol dehydrogenase family)
MANAKKVVVITGGSAGVGRATALAFVRQGATVALLARGIEGLQGAARDIEMMGGKALIIQADVADAAQVEAAASRVEEELGPIDVWVNNAMVTVFSTAAYMTAEEYKRVTEVSYLGTVYGTLAALKRMRLRNRGSIIQVGSALSYRGIPIQSAYCAAKFAARGFTDSVRVELMYEKSAIQLTTVHLSAFNTPQFEWARHRINAKPKPLPPIFQPELAADVIVWCASHKRREVYVGFPALKTILGNKLFPRLADRMARDQAISGQKDESVPAENSRDGNLFDPVPGDFGAHGRFDDQAKSHSLQLFITLHRTQLLAVSVMIMMVLIIIILWIR